MRSTIALASLLFAGACATDETINYGETESHVETENRIAANRIAANRIAANRIAANGLAYANNDALVDTADGRELLDYIISCALPPGQQLALTDTSGALHTFDGWLGLAPGWATATATTDDRLWVSACLLSRTNLYGVSVPISIRGTNPALAVDASEANDFGLREGAFWGDLFDPQGVISACAGPDKLAGSTASSLPQRECAASDDGTTTRCGFTYAGPCATACTTDAAGNYQNCAGGTHAITVYLATP